MLPKIQALALEGVTVECRESTERAWFRETDENGSLIWDKSYWNRLSYPGQFEMICYKTSDNSSFVDSSGTFKWDNTHERDIIDHMATHYVHGDLISMETSFNLNTFELWILSDRCNPNHHCGGKELMTQRAFFDYLLKRLNICFLK